MYRSGVQCSIVQFMMFSVVMCSEVLSVAVVSIEVLCSTVQWLHDAVVFSAVVLSKVLPCLAV